MHNSKHSWRFFPCSQSVRKSHNVFRVAILYTVPKIYISQATILIFDETNSELFVHSG